MGEPNIVISGAGVAGLLLALSLKKQGLNVVVYEQAPEFGEGVGGGIGLYPNGLRIIRDISPSLLEELRKQGRSYRLRKWMRHDGSEVAVGDENYLVNWKNAKDKNELASMGIRRWRLQKALWEACTKAGITIKMSLRVESVKLLDDGKVQCQMSDASTLIADLVFGCDGVKSAIRTSLFGSDVDPKYTGITCLMGSAPIAEKSGINGICFPSSSTTNCHACYYPCNDKEIIFQLFFKTEERPETWKALSPEEGRQECLNLRETLIKDGWHKMFTDPLAASDSVLRVGLRARSPIPVWHASTNGIPRVFLLGDAAHPPVPYIGQGAMMAIEDVGILSELIQKFCKPSILSPFSFSGLSKVATIYEKLRLPRTTGMLLASQSLGDMQLARGNSSRFEIWKKETKIWLDVKRYGTLPIMFSGSGYDYKLAVANELQGEKGKANL